MANGIKVRGGDEVKEKVIIPEDVKTEKKTPKKSEVITAKDKAQEGDKT